MDLLPLKSSLIDKGMQIQSTNLRADQSQLVRPGSDDAVSLWAGDDVTASTPNVSQVDNLLSNESNSQSNQVPAMCDTKLKEVMEMWHFFLACDTCDMFDTCEYKLAYMTPNDKVCLILPQNEEYPEV